MTHVQADCQELGSAPEPYVLQSSMGYLFSMHYLYPCFYLCTVCAFILYCIS